MCVRRNVQHRELKFSESTRFALNNVMVTVSTSRLTDCPVSSPPLSCQNIQKPHEKSPASHRAQGETQTSLPLGANPEGKVRVEDKASRILSTRVESAPLFVRRSAQHRELKVPEFARFALIAVVLVAASIDGPTGCISLFLLSSESMQSHEKSPASHRAQVETPTMSLALGASSEGKERVEGKASRI